MTDTSLWSDDELFGFASDFHKDCFNFRPRNMMGRADANRIIQQCEDYLESMKKTESGREMLRADGWNV